MENNKYNELEINVLEWAKEKGILEKGTPLAQQEKTEEEVQELRDSLFAKRNGLPTFTNSKGEVKFTDDEIKDALGDILVTIIIQSKMQRLNLLDCLESAYNVISKRKGKMIKGQFVKES